MLEYFVEILMEQLSTQPIPQVAINLINQSVSQFCIEKTDKPLLKRYTEWSGKNAQNATSFYNRLQ